MWRRPGPCLGMRGVRGVRGVHAERCVPSTNTLWTVAGVHHAAPSALPPPGTRGCRLDVQQHLCSTAVPGRLHAAQRNYLLLLQPHHARPVRPAADPGVWPVQRHRGASVRARGTKGTPGTRSTCTTRERASGPCARSPCARPRTHHAHASGMTRPLPCAHAASCCRPPPAQMPPSQHPPHR